MFRPEDIVRTMKFVKVGILSVLFLLFRCKRSSGTFENYDDESKPYGSEQRGKNGMKTM